MIALPVPQALREGLKRYSGLEPGAAVPSPCISVCRMDAASGLCAGCWRTLDEIAAWSTLAEEGKHKVWALIAQRTQTGG